MKSRKRLNHTDLIEAPMDVPAECFECESYVRLLVNDQAWHCSVCSLNESRIYLSEKEGYHRWGRYELYCGHQVHPLCYRQWCARTKGVGCPCCGPLSKKEATRFCPSCDSFCGIHAV